MEAVLINIEDFEHSGEGGLGESLNHKTNPNLLLKLYESKARADAVLTELENARKAYSLGIPTPKPGEFVTDGNGRYGMLFERIVGKCSVARAVGDNPDKVEYYARRFAGMCRQLHSTHIPEGMFPNVKDHYRALLNKIPHYTPEERARIEEVIDNAPDGDTAIHGDLQFGNMIMVGDKNYFIDLGYFTCGAPEFDLGMVLFTSMYDNPTFLREVFHMEPATAAEFWKYFVKGYYGEDADPKEIELKLRPYAMLKLLIMEEYFGALTEYHWLFKA